MRFLLIFLFCCSNLISEISLEDLDFIRSISESNTESIINNGTKFCNDYFDKRKFSKDSSKYENFFMCKFSKKRNRFYIYMLGVDHKENLSVKNHCTEILNSRPEISDHMEPKLNFQKKNYLSGFYIDNFFNDKVLNFFNDRDIDNLILNNEINEFIIKNRYNFSDDNVSNNELVSKEIQKLNRIYKKIIDNYESDLDKVIKNQLEQVVRYKIFINDTKKFISYSCNWQPGNGMIPYVKREKFKEFENI